MRWLNNKTDEFYGLIWEFLSFNEINETLQNPREDRRGKRRME